MTNSELVYKNRLEKVGLKTITNDGYLIEIIEYNGANNIIVKYEDGHVVKTSFDYFKKGTIRNKFHKSNQGIGFIGVGKYRLSTKAGQLWYDIFYRCYSPTHHLEQPTYKNCTIHPEWHNFQNFAKWFEENFDPIKHKNFHLDKDLLVRGNKIYGPDTCSFVPIELNGLFLGDYKQRILPTGVLKCGSRFTSSIKIDTKDVNLGTFNTPEQASEVYKIAKEENIKRLTEKFKGSISNKLYLVLMSYKM